MDITATLMIQNSNHIIKDLKASEWRPTVPLPVCLLQHIDCDTKVKVAQVVLPALSGPLKKQLSVL